MIVCSAQEAVSKIMSGDRVFVHGMAAAPQALIASMTARGSELKNVEIVHLHTEGPAPYTRQDLAGSFRVNALGKTFGSEPRHWSKFPILPTANR